MITFRGMLDAMSIPYVDDGSPELDYEVRVICGEDDITQGVESMVNDHEGKVIVLGTGDITK